MKTEKKSRMSALFAYAEGEKKKLVLSVILSVLSVALGLVPFYCMYRMICLFVAGTATTGGDNSVVPVISRGICVEDTDLHPVDRYLTQHGVLDS